MKRLRARLMQRWWELAPGKPRWLQNGVARIGCALAGHERGRAVFCDWCGKDLRRGTR